MFRLFLPLLQDISQMGKVSQAHCCMEFGVLTVDSYPIESLMTIMTEVAQKSHLLQEFRLRREYSSPFYRMENLGGMEACGRNIAIAEDRPAIDPDSEGMRTVVDDFEMMLLCDTGYGLHITGNPIDMRGKDSGRKRSDGSFYFCRVDVAGTWVYIYIDRFASFPDDAAGSGHIRKRRGDDLTGQFQRLDGNLNRDGAVSGIEQMFHSQKLLQALLKFIDQRTVVGLPVALPYPIQPGLVFRLGRKEGFGDGDQGCRI